MSYFTDEELIIKAQKGDKEAYKTLFDKYSNKVMSYLYRYVGDYQIAEDVTIETFLDVYKRLPAYKEEGKFLSWVYKIATNFARKEFRKRKVKEVSLDKEVSGESGVTFGDLTADQKARPDQEVIANELGGIIEEVIAKLDEKYKGVLVLCDVQGLSYEEAGKVLKCSKMTVGTRLNRARKLFYEALRRSGYKFGE